MFLFLADLTVQRIVVRNGLSMDLADSVLGAIRDSVAYLDSLSGPTPDKHRPASSFTH